MRQTEERKKGEKNVLQTKFPAKQLQTLFCFLTNTYPTDIKTLEFTGVYAESTKIGLKNCLPVLPTLRPVNWSHFYVVKKPEYGL